MRNVIEKTSILGTGTQGQYSISLKGKTTLFTSYPYQRQLLKQLRLLDSIEYHSNKYSHMLKQMELDDSIGLEPIKENEGLLEYIGKNGLVEKWCKRIVKGLARSQFKKKDGSFVEGRSASTCQQIVNKGFNDFLYEEIMQGISIVVVEMVQNGKIYNNNGYVDFLEKDNNDPKESNEDIEENEEKEKRFTSCYFDLYKEVEKIIYSEKKYNSHEIGTDINGLLYNEVQENGTIKETVITENSTSYMKVLQEYNLNECVYNEQLITIIRAFDIFIYTQLPQKYDILHKLWLMKFDSSVPTQKDRALKLGISQSKVAKLEKLLYGTKVKGTITDLGLVHKFKAFGDLDLLLSYIPSQRELNRKELNVLTKTYKRYVICDKCRRLRRENKLIYKSQLYMYKNVVVHETEYTSRFFHNPLGTKTSNNINFGSAKNDSTRFNVIVSKNGTCFKTPIYRRLERYNNNGVITMWNVPIYKRMGFSNDYTRYNVYNIKGSKLNSFKDINYSVYSANLHEFEKTVKRNYELKPIKKNDSIVYPKCPLYEVQEIKEKKILSIEARKRIKEREERVKALKDKGMEAKERKWILEKDSIVCYEIDIENGKKEALYILPIRNRTKKAISDFFVVGANNEVLEVKNGDKNIVYVEV